MMSFSMLAAVAFEAASNARIRRTIASIEVYRHDMYDARGDQNEKERNV
jgi:hypothetical protein